MIMNSNSNKKEKGILVLLLFAVLLMTVGFAVYSQTLTINGTVTVKANKWLVLYKSGDGDITVTSGSVTNGSGELGTDVNEPTNFQFVCTLNKPGDFYEATFKAHNYGSFDADLKTVHLSALNADQAKYLTYKVTYNGTTYTAGTTATSNAVSGVKLAAGADHPVVVRVEYVQPANQSDLPSTDQTVTVTGSLDYEQSAS